MTRRILLFAFLGVALAIAIIFPFGNYVTRRTLLRNDLKRQRNQENEASSQQS